MRWDNTVAILTGDYLFARASEISTDLGTEVCRLLARTIAVLCDGQIREVDSSGKVEQDDRRTTSAIIRRKTASLIATSCRLGGMLSDATPEHIEVLEGFGDALGMAYQLSDDIMDITVEPDGAGQGAGPGHARRACTRCRCCTPCTTARTARSSRRILAHGAPDGEMLDRALEIVRSGGSIERARRAVDRRGRQGDAGSRDGCPRSRAHTR